MLQINKIVVIPADPGSSPGEVHFLNEESCRENAGISKSTFKRKITDSGICLSTKPE
jgi:hypothetical protein